jgi:hypothetical protein
MDERPEPTDEQLRALLHDGEFLLAHGYRLTPKGYMSLALLDAGLSKEFSDIMAQKMEDEIFKGGWIYVRADEIELVDLDD